MYYSNTCFKHPSDIARFTKRSTDVKIFQKNILNIHVISAVLLNTFNNF